ncbi:MAG: uroporphyrinogen decarboxylase family protein [Phycisphaerae bacterium]|nr:uroporphyrinogen decarboxylase family protein [Phycisphaerae bacterium]
MNSYERYVGVLNGQAVDLVPRVPILMQYAAEHIESNYGEFAADHNTLVRANVACAETFGIDQLSCISDPYREAQGFGSQIEYQKNGPPRGTQPLEQTKDLSTLLQPDPLQSERMLDRVQAVRSYKSRFSGQYSILGWIEGPAAEAADLRGVGTFFMDMIEDPAFACDLMDRCLDVGIAFARAQVDAGADTIGIGDAVASQVSPDMYEALIQPREKQLVQAIRRMGAYAKLHICGSITHLLPGIADLGVDILDVDHMVSLTRVREAVGSKVTITGNIDPVQGVLRGTPASIRQVIQQAYRDVGNPYMVNAGCEIPSGTPVENLKALCEPVPYT